MNSNNFVLENIPSFDFNHNVLWIVFALLVVVFLIVSGILLFHWRRYGMKNSRIVLSEMVYLIGGGIFIFSALFSLIRI